MSHDEACPAYAVNESLSRLFSVAVIAHDAGRRDVVMRVASALRVFADAVEDPHLTYAQVEAIMASVDDLPHGERVGLRDVTYTPRRNR